MQGCQLPLSISEPSAPTLPSIPLLEQRGMSRCKEYLKGFLAQVEAKAGQEKGQLAEEFQVSKNYFSENEDWGLGEALK